MGLVLLVGMEYIYVLFLIVIVTSLIISCLLLHVLPALSFLLFSRKKCFVAVVRVSK
jgi:hypothetical protein